MSFRSGLGQVLTRDAESMTNAAVPIFDITGGCIMVTYIVGEIVGVAMGAGAIDLGLQFDDGVGAATPMCAVLTVSSDPIGTIYIVSGTPADPLRKLEPAVALAAQGGMNGGLIAGVGVLARGFICSVGSIERLGDAINAGTVKWTLTYIPMEEGVAVVVA